ncbi:hypothetical protein [Streptomyces sp. NPDC056188]|uniref:hypothetical protein n=1 Tax=Streptomyces sp. NPDC056188 TaxID=3345740 RepID=UPI0035DF4307
MTDPATGLTETQMAYNVAQSEMFQLAAYGHHRYHPSGDCLTDEGKRQQSDYNDRIRAAREELEAAVLRLVAEHGERYRTLPTPVVGWLRTLADDPAELSLLAVRPDEREEILDGRPAPSAAVPPAGCQPQAAGAVARVRAYLDALPNAANLGAEFAYGKQFRSEAWPHDSYPLTREDVEALLAAAQQPPADRAAVRDDLLRAIDPAYANGVLGYATPEALLAAYDTARAGVDRAAVLREAYEIAYAEGMRLNALEAEIGVGPYRGALAVAHLLRKAISDAQEQHRMADETPAVGAAVEPDETDEERADREETERDHTQGDHTHCGITCEAEMPTEHLRNFVIAKGYPGTKGALDELLRRARTEVAAVLPTINHDTDTVAVDLPARLEASLTERYTELGNPFSEMRRREQGPDGWPASHPVGPHHVAQTLRELLADEAQQGEELPS